MNADACDTVGMTAQHELKCCISFQNKEKKILYTFFCQRPQYRTAGFFRSGQFNNTKEIKIHLCTSKFILKLTLQNQGLYNSYKSNILAFFGFLKSAYQDE